MSSLLLRDSRPVEQLVMPGLDVSNLMSEGGGQSAARGKSRPAVPKVGRGSGILDAHGRDLELEHGVLQWIMSIIHEKPSVDYDHFIQDGSVLSKVMTSIVFNSVPLEQIEDNWGVNPVKDRVKAVIREIRRYGVVDVFEPEELIELKNVPKVTRCLAQLSKLAASDKDNLLATHHS